MTDQSADRIRPAVAAVTAIRPKIAQIDIGDGFAVASAELPHTPPSGGDFHAAFPLHDGSGDIGVVLGDVAGHGPDKTEQAQRLLSDISERVAAGTPPAAALSDVNAEAAADPTFEGFATAFVGTIKAETGVLSYASAGQEPAMVAPASPQSTDDVTELETTGPPVGVAEARVARYAERKAKVPEGGTLLLYSDGVSQVRNPVQREWLGIKRVKSLFARVANLRPLRVASTILGRALAFGRKRVSDDMTAMAIRRKP